MITLPIRHAPDVETARTLATLTTDHSVFVTTRDGVLYGPMPVIERRGTGFRFGFRAGFGPQDLFIASRDIASVVII